MFYVIYNDSHKRRLSVSTPKDSSDECETWVKDLKEKGDFPYKYIVVKEVESN